MSDFKFVKPFFDLFYFRDTILVRETTHDPAHHIFAHPQPSGCMRDFPKHYNMFIWCPKVNK